MGATLRALRNFQTQSSTGRDGAIAGTFWRPSRDLVVKRLPEKEHSRRTFRAVATHELVACLPTGITSSSFYCSYSVPCQMCPRCVVTWPHQVGDWSLAGDARRKTCWSFCFRGEPVQAQIEKLGKCWTFQYPKPLRPRTLRLSSPKTMLCVIFAPFRAFLIDWVPYLQASPVILCMLKGLPEGPVVYSTSVESGMKKSSRRDLKMISNFCYL